MSEVIFHLDFETYSAADLKKYGAYRYACDPSTGILIFAIAADDRPPLVWDVLDSFGENAAALLLFETATKTGSVIYAHNAQFEAAVCRYVLKRQLGLDCPDLSQWRCTAAMARRAAIPSSLAGVGEFLGLDVTKDKEGSRLIRKFSIPRRPTKKDPRTRIHPQDDPEDFRAFGEYCRQDVETERAAHKVLHAFELEGAVLESFQFDLRMNEIGVPVNVEALKRADKMINEYTARLGEQFREITGLNHTQRDAVHKWLRERGYPYPNLQAGNVDEVLDNGRNGWETRYIELSREQEGEEWLEVNPDKPLPAKFTAPTLQPVEMTEEAFEALRIRSLVAFAAVKKVPTMLNAVCPDGRVRGALMWSGAERTHRWAGRIIQPQNFRRPTFEGTEQAYKMLCEGADIDTLEMLFAPFLEIIASCIRHFIQLPDGQQMIQADYSSVEARGNPWLCGAETTLQLFRDGVKVYELMAAKIFNVPLEEVTKDQRFVGKQAILGCLGEGTKVLTNEGWKNIEHVTKTNKLWDGGQWVDHKGLIYQGMKKTLNVSGLWLTPDHRILCGNQWKASQVVQNENILCRALVTGAVNLLSPDLLKVLGVGAGRWLSSVIAAARNMAFCSTTSKGSSLPVAQYAPPRKALKQEKNGGVIATLYHKTKFVKDYLIGYLPKLAVATTPTMQTSTITAGAGFQFVGNGGQTVKRSSNTAKVFKGGTTRPLKSTVLMLTGIMNRAIYGLLQGLKTWQTKEVLPKCKNDSTNLKRKMRTYDLLCAGPNQRFTVLTEQGPVIVHNCGYNMGRPKFRGTCESYNFTPPQSMIDEFKPRFRKQLAHMRQIVNSPEPWDEFEIKFPKFKWARLRNTKDGFRVFSVYAYRKATPGKSANARKIADPDNPTAEEWLDLAYDDLADRAVTTWREDNPEVVQAWKDIDTAAKQAIQNPGKIFKATDKISFGVTEKPGFRALVMRLPSGHTLIYPRPKLVWKGEGEPDASDYYNIEIHFWGKVPMKSTWGWCKTYGGKLLENATQAICGDFMANGACNASKRGYDIFMLVHDEAIGPQKPGQTQEELCRLLCELPKWAAGMPLAADGNIIPFYKKT